VRTKRPSDRVVAKGVQLRLLRQRVVMAAQKAQADVLLHRPHCALPATGVGRYGGEARRARRLPQCSPGQARAWADGGFDRDHGLGRGVAGRSAIRAGGARWKGGLTSFGCAGSLPAVSVKVVA
jgi:hypothetical protein